MPGVVSAPNVFRLDLINRLPGILLGEGWEDTVLQAVNLIINLHYNRGVQQVNIIGWGRWGSSRFPYRQQAV